MNQVVWATKNAHGTRIKDDFYSTPPECVMALLPYIEDFPGPVWEPACGDGAISKVLLADGWSVFSSDIVNRGYPHTCTIDFLERTEAPAFSVVTNPPYKIAEEFVRKAFELDCMHIAMLLKSNFWHVPRHGLFEQHTPDRILPLTWRPDFTGGGSPFLDVAWSIWRPLSSGARMTRLPRPSRALRVLTKAA